MLRKFVTILTILAISLSAILPVQLFAAADIGNEGRICRDLGILKGDTGVVDSDYLGTRPSRLQAAIMFLRLKGLEQKALAYTGGGNFKDASAIAWKEGRNVLSYLKDHPELGWIGDGVNFLPYNLIDSKAYYKVLLESLGYKQKIDGVGDFDWSSVLEFAEGKGLKKVADEKYFTVECLAIATVEALNTRMKNTGEKLIDYLVEIGAVDREAARDLEMYTEDIDAEVKYVRAISNTKVEVVFTEPVGSDADDEDLYTIKQLDIKDTLMKNDSAVIIETSSMNDNSSYTLVFDGKSYSFKGLKKDSYAPKLISAECKDTELVELTFDRILDIRAAQDTDTYTIVGVTVKSAELDSTNTKVRLTTSGIDSGRSYEMKIHNIKNADGVTTKLITKRFVGRKDITAPKLNKLTVLNNIRLLLEFSDSNGLDKATAQDVDNYRITSSSGELEVEDAIVKDTNEDGMWETVELVTESQDSGKQYTLIIEEMTDASVSRNSITREIKKEFRGKGEDRSGPVVARNPVAVTNTMVEIEFSDSNALDKDSACDTGNYEIDGLDIIEARIKNPSDRYSAEGRTVYLITDEMEKSKSYTLTIYGIQDEFGNEMKASGGSKTYRFRGLGGDRTPPYVTFVECIDSRTIQLSFDNLLDEESAESIMNYRIDGLALVTKAVLQKDGKTVRLTVSSLSSDRNHTVSLNNIEDLSGNALSNVNVSILYKGNLYDDDPPEVSYIEAVNRDEVWIHFEEEVYADKAVMKASGVNFHQKGSVLDGRTTVVMKASSSLDDKEYEVTSLEGIRDLRNNQYKLEDNLEFYGTDIENDPPEIDDWHQVDIRRFRVIFSEPVLMKDNWTSGISGSDITWRAILNPEGENDNEAYSTVDFVATNRNIPAEREYKFNFTKIVTDYAGKDAWDDEDYNGGTSGSTILESYIEDDEDPYIEYVEALTRNKAQIVFNEAIREPGRYNITYEDDKGKLRTIDIELTEVDAKDNTKVNLYTRDQMSDEYYYILEPVSAALDIAGNKLDIRDLEIEFEGSNIMGSEFVQDVDILNKDTLWVTKSSSITSVTGLYKLGSDGSPAGSNLIEAASRVSDNIYEVASKEPLYKDVRYEITVDGLKYRFYGEYEGKASKSSAKNIYSFTLKGRGFEVHGSIDEKNGIIRIAVPYGTDVDNITPVIKYSEGASIVVKSKSKDEAKKNNLLRIIIYTVIAEDGSKKDYEVRISEEGSVYEKKITSFVFTDFEPDIVGKINDRDHVINLTVPAGTVVTDLVPDIETSSGTKVSPESGKSNNFERPVIYKVVARDGSVQNYTVVVDVAEELDKSIRSFEFKGLSRGGIGVINHEKGTIAVTVPYDTDLTRLTPTIVIPENTRISPKSGEEKDFRRPVDYIVTARDRTVKKYTVYVTKALSSGNRITSFSFPGYGPAAAVDVKEEQRLIELTVPDGTDRSKLIASFTVSPEAVVKVREKVQESGVTDNDFRDDVKYVVTAQDGTIREYKVRVSVAPNSVKQIKQFGFTAPKVKGTIDEAAKQISIKVPYGTKLNEIIAVFTVSEGSKVLVNGIEQKSEVTKVDFSGQEPVVYTVAAQDGSIQEYTVKVTAAAENEPMITSFAFNGLKPPAVAVIDHINHTINVTVPRGTVLRKLAATFEHNGKSIEARAEGSRKWIPQTSGVTTNDFGRKIIYRITPNEGSPVDYTVIVKVSEERDKNDDRFNIRR